MVQITNKQFVFKKEINNKTFQITKAVGIRWGGGGGGGSVLSGLLYYDSPPPPQRSNHPELCYLIWKHWSYHSLSRYGGSGPRKMSKPQHRSLVLDVGLYLTVHKIFLNFSEYSSWWLHISPLTAIPIGRLLYPTILIRKYNEFNHIDRAETNINPDKKKIQDFFFRFQIILHCILIDYGQAYFNINADLNKYCFTLTNTAQKTYKHT